MKVSLFYKSCAKDFEWLRYSRDSVRKFCSGFHEIVLCLPEGETFDWPEANIVHVREDFTGYCFQQAVKTFADTWCSGDFITFQDSDTVFSRPMDASELFRDGKPIWITRPYGEARSDQQVWRKPTEAFLGDSVDFEGMYRHPMTTSRVALQRMRGFCQFKHGISMDEYIRRLSDSSRPLALVFSEFNALSAFANRHCPEEFHWIDASKEEPPPACSFQGYSHGGEQRKQEDLAKFREILDTPCVPTVGHNTAEEVPGVPPPLTEDGAISFLAEHVRDNAHKGRIIRKLKKQWEGKGAGVIRKNKRIVTMASGFLLAIHSYPGANETVTRHWDNFVLSGASRIVGIGTTDGGCRFPCESVNIGENAYMKLKGPDDHLCRRLLDTVKWCLTQPEDKFVICEYDTLFLRRFPDFNGINACQTGGRVNGSKANQFHHNPWAFDRITGEKLVAALEKVLPECQEYPDNSPDLFFGYAMEKAGIEVRCEFKMFTRNTIEGLDIELARAHSELGTHVIHGVKTKEAFDAITSAKLETAA
jgi:hypothetical protein